MRRSRIHRRLGYWTSELTSVRQTTYGVRELTQMQNFCRDVGRSSPCLNGEFAQDSLDMLADGAGARSENFGDLAVPLALAHPKQHFGFAFGRAERLQRISIKLFTRLG